MSPSPSSLPLFGEVAVRVSEVRSISIHGDAYFDVVVVSEAGGGAVATRVAGHLCHRPPAPGDRVRLTLLMSQVSAVAFVDDAV